MDRVDKADRFEQVGLLLCLLTIKARIQPVTVTRCTEDKESELYEVICIYVCTIHMYSGITSGRVLSGELLYTKILEVNLFAFAYRLFRRDFIKPSQINKKCI